MREVNVLGLKYSKEIKTLLSHQLFITTGFVNLPSLADSCLASDNGCFSDTQKDRHYGLHLAFLNHYFSFSFFHFLIIE